MSSSAEWIHDLKVADLKEELKKRGLPVGGKKAELSQRLEEHCRETAAEGDEAASAGNDVNKTAVEEEEFQVQETEEPTATEKEIFVTEPPGAEEVPPGDQIKQQDQQNEDDPPLPAIEASTVTTDAVPEPSSNHLHEEEVKEEKKEEETAVAAHRMKRPLPTKGDEPITATAEETHEPPKKVARIDSIETTTTPTATTTTAAAAAATAATATTATTTIAATATKAEKSITTTRALLIEGFVRPFTLNAAQQLISQNGTILAMWMPSIKNIACVVFATKSQAEAAKTSLWELQWPAGSPKKLLPRYISLADAEKVISKGMSNPDFVIERTDEDDPLDIWDRKAEKEINVAISTGGKKHQDAQHKDGVKDLRELLTSRRSLGGKAATPVAVDNASGNKAIDEASKVTVPVDEVFKKTKALPTIYWLPASNDLVEERKKKRGEKRQVAGR